MTHGASAAFSIRPARSADLPAIVAMRDALNALELTASPHAPIQRLSVDEFAAMWGATFDDPTHCWRIAEAEAKPVGFGLLYLLPRTRPLGAFIHWLYLDPEHRCAGRGRALFDHLAEWARARDAVRIELQFIEGNEGARQFWRGWGFSRMLRSACAIFEAARRQPSGPDRTAGAVPLQTGRLAPCRFKGGAFWPSRRFGLLLCSRHGGILIDGSGQLIAEAVHDSRRRRTVPND